MSMRQLPFDNLRVLDFGWVWAGAVVGQILGDMGAEVIKVESRRRLDPARQGRPIVGDVPDPEQNPLFHNVNRGKLSTTLDLTHPRSRPLVKRLIEISDILVENMTPEGIEKLSLDYERVKEINPSIIMLSYPVAGSYGPFRNIRGYAPTATSLSGIDSLVGYPGEPALGMGGFYGDPNVGLHGAVSVLSALWHRKKTGEGQYIDLSMWEAAVCTIGEAIMEYTMNGRILGSQGNVSINAAPSGVYPCKGDDKWICIVVKTEEEWNNLCQAMENPSWANEERFSDLYQRVQNQEALNELMSQWTIHYDHYELAESLQQKGVAATPCLNTEDRFLDQRFNERENYVFVEHPVLGSEPVYGIPYKLSETPGQVKERAPLMGEHNDYVFGELLRLSPEEIEKLKQNKVIY
ncbi:MAG: CoA transferase [Chloroflexota bacterium]|nr:CoA transferase [Chloroflexota bacterium]